MLDTNSIKLKDIVDKTFTYCWHNPRGEEIIQQKKVVANITDAKGKPWLIVRNTSEDSEQMECVKPMMFMSWLNIHNHELWVA